MDQAVDARIGAAYGSVGERRMVISVAVPIGDSTAETLVEKLAPKVRSPTSVRERIPTWKWVPS